jgi:hypothetical protein
MNASPSWLTSIARLRPPAGRPTEQSSGLTGSALRAAIEAYDAGMRAAFDQHSQPKLLQDGTTGWPARVPREDDCFNSAIATTLQVPIARLPDPRIDQRLQAGETPEDVNRLVWSQLDQWLTDRGLRIVVHRKMPVARRRWIGIVPMPGFFRDHCLVMAHDRVIFDPIWHATEDGTIDGRRLRKFSAEEVTVGLSFARNSARDGAKHDGNKQTKGKDLDR